eukprot:scaffold19253_cov124-Isochrysis_galbana.AAC.1
MHDWTVRAKIAQCRVRVCSHKRVAPKESERRADDPDDACAVRVVRHTKSSADVENLGGERGGGARRCEQWGRGSPAPPHRVACRLPSTDHHESSVR